MRLNKRGQITIFIILGILIVAGALLFLYLKNFTTVFQPALTEPENSPIQQYVDSCIYDTAKNAIITMGMQSGFVEIPTDILFTPTSYLSVDQNKLVKRPYWYFSGQNRIPTPEYLRYQISKYVEDNIGSCLNNFEKFQSIYEIKTGKPKANTILEDESVKVTLDYEITIKDRKENKLTKINEFNADIPVRLKKVYELAVKIMQHENNFLFIENMSMDLLAADPKIPFSGMEFQCSPLTWKLSDIRQETQRLLFYNLPRVRIENTNYTPFLATKDVYEKFRKYTMEDINNGNFPKEQMPDDAYEYFHMLFDVGNTDPSLVAKFVYRPEYGMDFIGIPQSNGELRSDLIRGPSEYLRFLCINLYHFVYDINFPIETYIIDQKSFQGEGYTFTFAFPAIIYHNLGTRNQNGVYNFDRLIQSQGFCEDRTQKAEFRVMGEYEGLTDMEIPDVNIDYQCMGYRCSIGKTEAEGGHYKLTTLIPGGCLNPIITANKTGYAPAQIQLTNESADIYLTKLKTLDINIDKYTYTDGGTLQKSTLGSDYQVFIQITDKNATYSQTIRYPDEKTIDIPEKDNTYQIDATLAKTDDYAGGYTTNFPITYDQIISSQKLTIPVIEYLPMPVSDIDKAKMANYIFSQAYNSTAYTTLS